MKLVYKLAVNLQKRDAMRNTWEAIYEFMRYEHSSGRAGM